MAAPWSNEAVSEKTGFLSVEQREHIPQTPYDDEPEEPVRWRENHEDARVRQRRRLIYFGFFGTVGLFLITVIGWMFVPSVSRRILGHGDQANAYEQAFPAVSVVTTEPPRVIEPEPATVEDVVAVDPAVPQPGDVPFPSTEAFQQIPTSAPAVADPVPDIPQIDPAAAALDPVATAVLVPILPQETSLPVDAEGSAVAHELPATPAAGEEQGKTGFKPHIVDPVTGKRLHLLLPATEKNEHLCKTLFTAAANGYPSPVLINWGMVPGEGEHMVSHLKKINGVNDYLGSLGPEMADDLVLMTDAYDVWFQLPAEVLIGRYHEIIEMENERIRKQYGSGALENGIKGRIVFAPDKGCVGHSLQDYECWAQPESLLPVDTYGDCTDTENGYYERSCMRHRWLNSGVIIGPVSDMLTAFKRAEKIAATIGPKEWYQSDQRVFGSIFGAQEISRQNMTIWNPAWLNGQPSVMNMPSPHEDPETTANFGAHVADWPLQRLPPFDNFEFGINIDYLSKMSHTTFSADYEWAWLFYNTTPAGPDPGLGGPKDCKLILKDLPQDIEHVQPIKALENTASAGSWKDVYLYTNLCSGEIPAIIHHNGDKWARNFAWPSLWFTKYWREILQSLHAQNSYDPAINDGGAASDKGEKLHWEDLCQAFEEPVFAFEQTKYSVPAMRKGAPGT